MRDNVQVRPLPLGHLVKRAKALAAVPHRKGTRYYVYANSMVNSPIEIDETTDDPLDPDDRWLRVCQCKRTPIRCRCQVPVHSVAELLDAMDLDEY